MYHSNFSGKTKFIDLDEDNYAEVNDDRPQSTYECVDYGSYYESIKPTVPKIRKKFSSSESVSWSKDKGKREKAEKKKVEEERKLVKKHEERKKRISGPLSGSFVHNSHAFCDSEGLTIEGMEISAVQKLIKQVKLSKTSKFTNNTSERKEEDNFDEPVLDEQSQREISVSIPPKPTMTTNILNPVDIFKPSSPKNISNKTKSPFSEEIEKNFYPKTIQESGNDIKQPISITSKLISINSPHTIILEPTRNILSMPQPSNKPAVPKKVQALLNKKPDVSKIHQDLTKPEVFRSEPDALEESRVNILSKSPPSIKPEVPKKLPGLLKYKPEMSRISQDLNKPEITRSKPNLFSTNIKPKLAPAFSTTNVTISKKQFPQKVEALKDSELADTLRKVVLNRSTAYHVDSESDEEADYFAI